MMKRILYFLITTILISSCSVLKQSSKTNELLLDEYQINVAIEKAITELVEGRWMTDFLLQKNERPVIAIARIINNTKANINTGNVYGALEIAILKTGQTRVVKTTNAQHLLSPIELSKINSIDFVLAVTFQENRQNSPFSPILELSLWNEGSTEPISTIKTEIE